MGKCDLIRRELGQGIMGAELYNEAGFITNNELDFITNSYGGKLCAH